MRYSKTAILFLVLFTPTLYAQESPAVFMGATGGSSFSNLFLGATARVEVPVRSHFEFDAQDTFSPLEEHTRLGHGNANVATIEPIVWLRPHFGLDGRFDASTYHTAISKHSYFVYSGIAIRGMWLDAPVKLTLDYFREVHNGIYGNGIETSHLQGGSLYLEAQLGCSKHACYYSTLEMNAGTLLQQGNPVCDGSGAPNPCHLPYCQRTRSSSGSGVMGFLVRFGGSR